MAARVRPFKAEVSIDERSDTEIMDMVSTVVPPSPARTPSPPPVPASAENKKARPKSFGQTADSKDHLDIPEDAPVRRVASVATADNKPVFLDPNAVKEQVRKNLNKEHRGATCLYDDTVKWTRIVKNPIFEGFMLSVITFNAIWIAVDTDHNDADTLMEAHAVFILAENIFCIIFTSEIFVRFMAFRHKTSMFQDGWFIFDSLLVTLMVLETWVFVLILALGAGAGSGLLENASILRIARMFRLARMARLARLLRAVPELMILIKGMLSAARSVFFTLCLLFILLYLFAIAMTQLTLNTDVGDLYFASVPKSMYSLFIYGSLLQNAGIVCDALGDESIIFAAVYLLFVILAALMVMNMLTGVLCEVVSAVAAIEKDSMLVSYVSSRMAKVVHDLDEDGDNCVSRDEFEQLLTHVDASRALQDVGVDVAGLVDFADVIFEEEETLSFGRFMEVVLELRGTNSATVKDMMGLRRLLRITTAETMEALARLTEFCRERLTEEESTPTPWAEKQNNKAAVKPSTNEFAEELGSLQSAWLPCAPAGTLQPLKPQLKSKEGAKDGQHDASGSWLEGFRDGEMRLSQDASIFQDSNTEPLVRLEGAVPTKPHARGKEGSTGGPTNGWYPLEHKDLQAMVLQLGEHLTASMDGLQQMHRSLTLDRTGVFQDGEAQVQFMAPKS